MKQYQSITINHPGLWGHEKIAAALTEQATPTQASTTEALWQSLEKISQQYKCGQLTDNQWITIVGKPSTQFLSQLRTLTLPSTLVRIIVPRSDEEALWATEQALLLGNSQLVVACVNFPHSRAQKRLSLIGNQSRIPYFVFSTTGQQAPLH